VLRDLRVLHELAVLLEDLDAIADAVADIDHPVSCDLDAADVVELSRRRGVRIVWAWTRGARLLAVGAPAPFVGTLVRVEHDDAVMAAVSDVALVRGVVDRPPFRPVQRRLALGAFHLAWRADLQEELSALRELQDVRVGRTGWRPASSTAA